MFKMFLAIEKNRGKKNDFLGVSFVLVTFMEALYDDTHIRESERSKKKKKTKKERKKEKRMW